jgi:hypothetical protein
MDRRVVRMTANGVLDRAIGRPGPGPGELTLPLAFGVDATDSARVFDFGKGIVEVFSPAGTYDHQYEPEIRGFPRRMSFGPEGRMVYTGTHPTSLGALVAMVDRSGREISLLGELVTTDTVIPPDLVEQLQQRRIPSFMQNGTLPIFDPEGGTWLIHQTEAVLEHFDAEGELDARQTVEVPEMTQIEDAYFEWYAAVQARDQLRYFTYVEDAFATHESLWLLWQTPAGTPGLVTRHDRTGRLCARLILEGVGGDDDSRDPTTVPYRRLAVDRSRSRLYLLDRNLAVVWAFSLPPAVSSPATCGHRR